MECLPFVKRIAHLRTYMVPESPGDFNRKVFLPKNCKQSGSKNSSSGGSINSEETASSSIASSVDTDYSTSTGGYMGDFNPFSSRQRERHSDETTTGGDDSTVFSLSNVMDIVISLRDAEDFLGVSIVGQNFSNGESNLFVGAVLPGGAVNRDGRIQPGDLILEVNGQSLDGKTNKEAVAMLREAVKFRREVTLTIVGSWDAESVYSERTCVRPIDPMLWLAHSSFAHNPSEEERPAAPQRQYRNLKSQTSIVSSSLSSSMPSTAAQRRTQFHHQAMPLETPTDVIANRLRLFIQNRNNSRKASHPTRNAMSMNGVDLQMWLYKNIKGFKDLAEVENYATHMISTDYLKPASTYLQPGAHNSSHFDRRENYIVCTRPTTPAIRSLTSGSQSSFRTSRSSTPTTVYEGSSKDHTQLLASVGKQRGYF